MFIMYVFLCMTLSVHRLRLLISFYGIFNKVEPVVFFCLIFHSQLISYNMLDLRHFEVGAAVAPLCLV